MKGLTHDNNNNNISLNIQDIDKLNSFTYAFEYASTTSIPREVKVSIVQDAAYVGTKTFLPNPAIIGVGGTITWIDNDIETHTITSGLGSNDPNSANLFDSGIFWGINRIFHTCSRLWENLIILSISSYYGWQHYCEVNAIKYLEE